ncbi:hypothetical protein ACWGI8_33920 [Streptomyces sp. NPDC054841]
MLNPSSSARSSDARPGTSRPGAKPVRSRSPTVGKAADFVVLSRDILRCASDDVPGTVAEVVAVGGEVVHAV